MDNRSRHSSVVAAGRWIDGTREDGATVLYLQGAWRLPYLHAVTDEIESLPLSPQQPCILDGSRLETLDTATVFVLLIRLVAVGYTRATVSLRRGRSADSSLA
ncbi:hypothetical protein [Variovorax sp. HW608]|uniref:hypothetical protein n=1 Tax=Variovorax sp. HW608 TaxID=1034889 RepID=UPI0012FD29F5|nr:hypothetical protein [Variovorax sp. HW608]